MKLRFKNKTAKSDYTIEVADRRGCQLVASWYGAFHAGDRYTVEIDGAVVPHDQNGDIK